MTMFDLGFFGVETDYPEQKSSLPVKRKKESTSNGIEKGVQQRTFEEKDSC